MVIDTVAVELPPVLLSRIAVTGKLYAVNAAVVAAVMPELANQLAAVEINVLEPV